MTPNKGIAEILYTITKIIQAKDDRFNFDGKRYKLFLKGSGSLYESKQYLELLYTDLVNRKFITEEEMFNTVKNHIIFYDLTLGYNDGNSLSINELYNISNYYISPYTGEGFNIPVLEALSVGVKVIVPETGSTSDFIDKIKELYPEFVISVGSTVVESGGKFMNNINVNDVLIKLANNPVNRPDPTALRNYIIENYSWKTITEQVIRYIDRILGESKE